METLIYTVSQFAKLIHRSIGTLQRWDRAKILVAKRTVTNRRYYTPDDLVKVLGQDAVTVLRQADTSTPIK